MMHRSETPYARTGSLWIGPLLALLWLLPGPLDAQAPEGERTTVHLTGSWSSQIVGLFELSEHERAWGLRAELDRRWRIRPFVGVSRAALGIDCTLIEGVVCPDTKGWVLVAGGTIDVLPDHMSSPIVPYVGGEAGMLIRSGDGDAAWAAIAGLRVPIHPRLSLAGEMRRARLERDLDQHWQALFGIRVSL